MVFFGKWFAAFSEIQSIVSILRFARTRDLYIFAALVHRAAQPAEAVAARVTLLSRSACPENAPGAPPPRNGRAGGLQRFSVFSVKIGPKKRGKMLDPSGCF